MNDSGQIMYSVREKVVSLHLWANACPSPASGLVAVHVQRLDVHEPAVLWPGPTSGADHHCYSTQSGSASGDGDVYRLAHDISGSGQ